MSFVSSFFNTQAFFPAVSEPHGFPIKIQDAEGKVWEFHFRYWPNAGSKMYVLEGLRDYMIEMKWQAGDVGKLFATKLVMKFGNFYSKSVGCRTCVNMDCV